MPAEGPGRRPDSHWPQPGESRPPNYEVIAAGPARPRAAMARMREHVGAHARYVRRKFPDVLDQVMARDRASG